MIDVEVQGTAMRRLNCVRAVVTVARFGGDEFVVLFRGHESHPDDVLKWADSAMYQAKQAGRNSVRFYAPGQTKG